MTITEITAKIRELKEVEALIRSAQEEAEAIKDAIKAEMTETGADALNAGEYRVTWKEVTTARIDTAAMKKALPDVVERFTKVSTTRRFLVA